MLAIFMMVVSNTRIYALLRLSSLLMAALLLSGQSAPPEQAAPPGSERIAFAYKNVSDLRGLLNVFKAFERACLHQPLTPDLAERLVPDGYQVVSRDVHYWGEDNNTFPNTAILSKTGREESDFAGGYPVIDLILPTAKLPHGDCSIVWKRSWDYSEKIQQIVVNLAAVLDAHVSYHLDAIRRSPPDGFFNVTDSYSFASDWLTPCWDDYVCAFNVFGRFDLKRGIDITISRRNVL